MSRLVREDSWLEYPKKPAPSLPPPAPDNKPAIKHHRIRAAALQGEACHEEPTEHSLACLDNWIKKHWDHRKQRTPRAGLFFAMTAMLAR